MNSKIKRLIIEIIAFVVLVIMDQYTKFLAVQYLKDKPPVSIIPKVLELYYLPNGNTGAAFGLLQGHQFLFIAIAIIVVAVIGYILFNIPEGNKYRLISVLLLFIAAGGVGNMIDRAMQSYVVDFIYFSIINFPIFNVADIYVSVSTVVIAIYMIFCIKEDDFKVLEQSLKAPFSKKK